MPQLHHYAVGELYLAGKTRWPEGGLYSYHQGGHALLLCVEDATPVEIAGIRRGAAEFALVVEAGIIFLCYQFGMDPPTGRPSLRWADCPYSWWLAPAATRTVPNPEPTELERVLLNITLLNARTGIIQALRVVTLSPEFSAALNQAIREQAAAAFPGQAAYDRTLQQIYAKYPDSLAMLRNARARCRGGD